MFDPIDDFKELYVHSKMSVRRNSTATSGKIRRLKSEKNTKIKNLTYGESRSNYISGNMKNPPYPVKVLKRAVIKNQAEENGLFSFQTVSELNQKITELQVQNEVLKRNHESELEFHIKKQFYLLLDIQKLFHSNQYEELQALLFRELYPLKNQNQLFKSSDQQTVVGLTLSDPSYHNQDDPFVKMISSLSKNLSKIGVKHFNIIPQVWKLSKEDNLTEKELAWYFEHLPFEVGSVEQRRSLTQKFLIDLSLAKGSQIVDLIIQNLQVANQSNVYHLKISECDVKKNQ